MVWGEREYEGREEERERGKEILRERDIIVVRQTAQTNEINNEKKKIEVTLTYPPSFIFDTVNISSTILLASRKRNPPSPNIDNS